MFLINSSFRRLFKCWLSRDNSFTSYELIILTHIVRKKPIRFTYLFSNTIWSHHLMLNSNRIDDLINTFSL